MQTALSPDLDVFLTTTADSLARRDGEGSNPLTDLLNEGQNISSPTMSPSDNRDLARVHGSGSFLSFSKSSSTLFDADSVFRTPADQAAAAAFGPAISSTIKRVPKKPLFGLGIFYEDGVTPFCPDFKHSPIERAETGDNALDTSGTSVAAVCGSGQDLDVCFSHLGLGDANSSPAKMSSLLDPFEDAEDDQDEGGSMAIDEPVSSHLLASIAPLHIVKKNIRQSVLTAPPPLPERSALHGLGRGSSMLRSVYIDPASPVRGKGVLSEAMAIDPPVAAPAVLTSLTVNANHLSTPMPARSLRRVPSNVAHSKTPQGAHAIIGKPRTPKKRPRTESAAGENALINAYRGVPVDVVRLRAAQWAARHPGMSLGAEWFAPYVGGLTEAGGVVPTGWRCYIAECGFSDGSVESVLEHARSHVGKIEASGLFTKRGANSAARQGARGLWNKLGGGNARSVAGSKGRDDDKENGRPAKKVKFTSRA